MTFTLTGMIADHARDRGESPALTLGTRTLTWAQLLDRSERVAAALQSAGVGRGDRVGVLAKNSIAFFELEFGCAKIGAVLVALNWRLAPPEIVGIVDDARPKIVFLGDGFAHLTSVLEPATQVRQLDDTYETWVAGWGTPAIDRDAEPDDVLLQLYSSGTTGAPKGVMLTHRNIGYTARMGQGEWRATSESVNLIPSPLFHVGGVVYALTVMGAGGHTVLLDRSDIPTILNSIEAYGVTHCWFVPTVIRDLLDARGQSEADLSSLQILGYGGSPIDDTLLLRAMAELDCGFLGVYGTTETASTLCSLAPEDHDPGGPRAGLLKSVGRPLHWVELKVVDPDSGTVLGLGEIGEICVRTAQIMAGYWRQPSATAAAVKDGWLHTGDAGYVDQDGFVFLKDRLQDMIISGGENVFPAEVENVLATHPDVAAVAVIGVPHERWGETVLAVVVPRPETGPSAAEIIAFTRDRLAHYKCPTMVQFVSELPQNASGKVLRRLLRELAHEEHWTSFDAARTPAGT